MNHNQADHHRYQQRKDSRYDKAILGGATRFVDVRRKQHRWLGRNDEHEVQRLDRCQQEKRRDSEAQRNRKDDCDRGRLRHDEHRCQHDQRYHDPRIVRDD